MFKACISESVPLCPGDSPLAPCTQPLPARVYANSVERAVTDTDGETSKPTWETINNCLQLHLRLRNDDYLTLDVSQRQIFKLFFHVLNKS